MRIIVLIILLIILCYFMNAKNTSELLVLHEYQQFEKNVDMIKSISKNLPLENKIMYPVLYINSDDNLERKIEMEKQFSKYGINATRISAIDTNDKNNGVDFISDCDLTDQEIATILSHLKAIKYAYDNNLDSVVIAEDHISLELMPFWTKNIHDITEELDDWDLLQLGNSSCDFSDSVIDNINIKECNGKFFYIINKNGIKNVIDSCFKNGIVELPFQKCADFLIFSVAGNTKSYMKPLVFTTIYENHETDSVFYWNKVLIYYIKKFFTHVELENTWLINLDRHSERLNYTSKRLSRVIIFPERWTATDAKSPDFIRFYNQMPFPKRSIGEVACYMSHKTLWKHIYDSNAPYGIIFEDDVILPKGVDKYEIIKRIKDSPDFNVIYLGHCYSTKVEIPYTKRGAALCLHAYVISRNCIENLLKSDDFSLPIDVIIKNLCEEELCYLSNYTENDVENPGAFGEGIIHQDKNLESSLESTRGVHYK